MSETQPRVLLDPGMYFDVPFADYNELDALSRRDLNFPTPRHFRADTKMVDSPFLAFGRAYHTMILEPEDFTGRYVCAPKVDKRTKEGKAAHLALAESNRTILNFETYDKLTDMCAELQAHPVASKLMRVGRAEVTIVWRDTVTELLCKARLDIWDEANLGVYDFKTTQDASRQGFGRSNFSYRYYRQMAWQVAGLKELGFPAVTPLLIAQETEKPYAVCVYKPSQASLIAGEQQNQKALRQIAECQKAHLWPAYPTEIQTLDLPPWAKNQISEENLGNMEEY